MLQLGSLILVDRARVADTNRVVHHAAAGGVSVRVGIRRTGGFLKKRMTTIYWTAARGWPARTVTLRSTWESRCTCRATPAARNCSSLCGCVRPFPRMRPQPLRAQSCLWGRQISLVHCLSGMGLQRLWKRFGLFIAWLRQFEASFGMQEEVHRLVGRVCGSSGSVSGSSLLNLGCLRCLHHLCRVR